MAKMPYVCLYINQFCSEKYRKLLKIDTILDRVFLSRKYTQDVDFDES